MEKINVLISGWKSTLVIAFAIYGLISFIGFTAKTIDISPINKCGDITNFHFEGIWGMLLLTIIFAVAEIIASYTIKLIKWIRRHFQTKK